jgi:uncharacterized protein (TIGR02598 family)
MNMEIQGHAGGGGTSNRRFKLIRGFKAGQGKPLGGRGFSLVEVLLALGVVTFGMIPVLGLLPTGLNTFRDSMNTTICSQIAQGVANELQQTDFDQLSLSAPIRYFDAQGNELPPTSKSSAVYHVNLACLKDTTLPGSAESNPHLATVVVQIALNPGNKPLVTGSGSLWTNQDIKIVTYSSKVASVN